MLVALVGPLFVDWTAYRAAFEEEAARVLGHPVRVTGTADATLLPVPGLTFTGLVIGADPAAPLMTVERFDLTAELFPLLQGEIRVTEMRLERPVATVRAGSDGTVDWASAGSGEIAAPGRVVLDRVDIVDGRVRIMDARRPAPVEITGINAAVEARSLSGPYKVEATLSLEGEPLAVRLSTGEADAAGQVVMKAAVTPANRPLALTFDGTARTEEGLPVFEGKAEIRRIVAEAEDAHPWSASATLTADPRRLLAPDLAVHYGPEDRPFTITGAVDVDLSGEAYFEAVLSARQIDLDRTLGAGPDQPVAFDGALAALAATLQALPRPPVDGSVGFDIPGVVVGGGILQDLRLDLATAPGGWRVEALEVALPGQSRLAASGDLAVSPPAFRGAVSVASDQPASLISWLAPSRPRIALSAFDAHADVILSGDGLKLAGLRTSLGAAALSGEASFLPATGSRAARVDLVLSADRLDLADAEAMAGLFPGGDAGGADLSIRLDAARFVAGGTDATGLVVDAAMERGTLRVDQLRVDDIGGARLSASGQVRDLATTPDGSLQARIAAEQVGGLVEVVRTLAPDSRFAAMLAVAAPVLSPTALDLTLTAARVPGGTNATLGLAGVTGGTTVDARHAFSGRIDSWRTAAHDLDLSLAGPDGVRLMRQLGFPVDSSPTGATAGSLKATARGVPAEGIDVSLEAAFGPTRARTSGRLVLAPGKPASGALRASLTSDDLGPLLALGGNLMADLVASMPVALDSGISVTGSTLGFTGLVGTLDGEPLSGDVTVDLSGALTRIGGTLSLRSASLQGLLELAFGTGTMEFPIVASRNPWPEAPFGPGALDSMETDLALAIGTVTLAEGLMLDSVSTALRSTAAGVAFDGLTAGFSGGKVAGALVVKRDLEGQAALEGRLSLSGVPAEALAWRRDDRAVVTGRLSAEVTATATGRTVAGLVSTLAGGGTIAVEDGVIRQMNPRAFASVIAAADAGKDLPEERIRDLFVDQVDAGDLAFRRIDGSFTLASGQMRVPSLRVEAGAASTSGSAVIDLAHQKLESDWTLAVPAPEAGAGTPPPQVDILFRGPLDDPQRRIDVTAFSSYLGVRAFERETERVLVMQADILERELLSRAVLREREAVERRLRAEEAARLAEEERLAEEARRAAEGDPAPSGDDPAAPDGAADGDPMGSFVNDIERTLEQVEEPAPPPAPTAPDGALFEDPEVLPDLPGVEIGPPPGGVATPGDAPPVLPPIY